MPAHPDQTLAEQLRDALHGFATAPEATIAALAPLYDADVVFSDPLQTLRGRDALLAMNARIVARARRLAFDVHDARGVDGCVFLTWTMTYRPRLGPTLVFEGASHARAREGRVVSQRDYWDLLSSVAASVPLVRRVYASLAPHLA